MSEKRALGSSGLQVSPLAFGAVVFGWTVDEEQAFGLLDQFVDAGLDLIDTADIYPWLPERPGNKGGVSETIIGKWIRSRRARDRVLIATKVGGAIAPGRKGLTRAHIVRSAEESLDRLQTDRIDLYQSHLDDQETPLAETLEAYGQLIDQGKVRAIGASNYTADRLREARTAGHDCGLPTYSALQPLYSLYDREVYEHDLAPVVAEQGLGVIPCVPLASGFLTGKYRSEADLAGSCRAESARRCLNARGFRILDALDEVAASYGVTPAGVALAWLMGQPNITAPIAGATTPDQLQALIASTQLQLDAASNARLTAASGACWP